MFFTYFERSKTARGLVGSFFNGGIKRGPKGKNIIAKKLGKFLASVFSNEDDEMVSHTRHSS